MAAPKQPNPTNLNLLNWGKEQAYGAYSKQLNSKTDQSRVVSVNGVLVYSHCGIRVEEHKSKYYEGRKVWDDSVAEE